MSIVSEQEIGNTIIRIADDYATQDAEKALKRIAALVRKGLQGRKEDPTHGKICGNNF